MKINSIFKKTSKFYSNSIKTQKKQVKIGKNKEISFNIDVNDILNNIDEYSQTIKEEMNEKNHYKNIKEILSSEEKDISFQVNPYIFLKDELSEEEFSSNPKEKDSSLKRNIRFRHPPQTRSEFEEVIKETDEIYNKNKYLLYNTNETLQNQRIKDDLSNKLPHNMRFKRLLLFPEHRIINNLYPQCEIYLIGIKEESDSHSNFLYSVIEDISPDTIVTCIPPDGSLFIHPDSSSSLSSCPEKAWEEFLKNPNEKCSFYISSRPRNISECTLIPQAVKSFVDVNLSKSVTMKKTPKLVFSKSSKLIERRLFEMSRDYKNDVNETYTNEERRFEYYGNGFLSSILYSYNSLTTEKYTNIVIGDMPRIEECKYIFNEYYLKTLQDQFSNLISNINQENYDYDPLQNLKYVETSYKTDPSSNTFKNVKTKYTIEVIKQASLRKKKVIAVVDYRILDEIVSEWEEECMFNENLTIKTKDFSSFYINRLNNIEKSGIDLYHFIEKAVLIDFLSNGFFSENYIKHRLFPMNYDEILYKARIDYDSNNNSIESKNFFVTSFFPAWEYYFSQYYKKFVEELVLVEKIYVDYIKKYNSEYENAKFRI